MASKNPPSLSHDGSQNDSLLGRVTPRSLGSRRSRASHLSSLTGPVLPPAAVFNDSPLAAQIADSNNDGSSGKQLTGSASHLSSLTGPVLPPAAVFDDSQLAALVAGSNNRSSSKQLTGSRGGGSTLSSNKRPRSVASHSSYTSSYSSLHKPRADEHDQNQDESLLSEGTDFHEIFNEVVAGSQRGSHAEDGKSQYSESYQYGSEEKEPSEVENSVDSPRESIISRNPYTEDYNEQQGSKNESEEKEPSEVQNSVEDRSRYSKGGDPLKDEGGESRVSSILYETSLQSPPVADQKSVRTEGSILREDVDKALKEQYGDESETDLNEIPGFEDVVFDASPGKEKGGSMRDIEAAKQDEISSIDDLITALEEHTFVDGDLEANTFGDEEQVLKERLLDEDSKMDEGMDFQLQDFDEMNERSGAILSFAEGEPSLQDEVDERSGATLSFVEGEPLLQDEEKEGKQMLQDEEKEGKQILSVEGKLPENMFSFMISSSMQNTPYITALTLIFLKLSFLSMLVADLTTSDTASNGNPLGVPLSVSWPVAVTQVLALGITAFIQDDLMKGLNLLREGYYKGADFGLMQEGFYGDGIGQAFGGVSKNKWRATIFWQNLAGIVGLGATFLLIVTSSDVFELLLAFSVVSFISQLDKAAFVLAKSDFLGSILRDEARNIMITTYQIPSHKKKSNLPALVFIISLLGMLGGWVYIIVQQTSGAYLPQTLILQLDDGNNVELGFLSGLYTMQSSPIRYVRGEAKLMFCVAKSVWTLRNGGDDPCANFLAVSAETKEPDISITSQIDWFAVAAGRTLAIESFFLAVGCSSDDDCGGADRGTCDQSSCKCKNEYYGLRCEFEVEQTCPILEIDHQTTQFRSTRTLSTRYYLLRNSNGRIVQVYKHAVYTNSRSSKGVDVILYSGLRWVVTSTDNLVGLSDRTVSGLIRYFEGTSFDASKYFRKKVDQVSSVARFDTISDQPAPINLPWSPDLASARFVGPADTRLVCRTCNRISNPCLNQGICSVDDTCNCLFGATGDLCQIAPTGNGRCDPLFNTALHDFDGGDCCSSTCISSSEFSCGEVATRSGEATSYAGFPLCEDPTALGCDVSGACWSTRGGDVALLTSGSSSLLNMASNGMSLVISEPALGTIRVFDQVDEMWMLRGEALEGDPQSELGKRVALSAPPGDFVARRVGRIPLVLATSLKKQQQPAVRIWEWGSDDVMWSQVCGDIVISCRDDCEVRSISVGREGNRGVLALALTDGSVSVFQILFSLSQCVLQWMTAGSSVHLSGNGERLAVVLGSSSLAEFAIFDVSAGAALGLAMRLEYDTDDNLVSKSYRESFKSRRFDQEASFALSHDGRVLNLAVVGSDSLVSVDTLRVSKESDQYELSASVALDTVAARLPDAQSEVGLSSVVFSNDGASVGIKGLDNSIQVFRFIDVGQVSWQSSLANFQATTLENVFTVSRNGGILASADDDAVEVVGVTQSCRDGETDIRVSIVLDVNPEGISWYLDIVQVEDDNLVFVNRTIGGCQTCYEQDSASFVVLQQVCVPDSLANCVRLTFRTEELLSPGAGVAGFVNGAEFAFYNGQAGDSEYFVASSDVILAADCPANRDILDLPSNCDQGDSLFAAFLTFDSNPEEVEWTLQSIDTGDVLTRGSDYDSSLAATTVAAGICVPSDSECLLFTITDSQDDGLCCGYGYGDVTLYLGGEKVYNPSGRFSAGRQEVYLGTGCPPTVGPTPAPTVARPSTPPSVVTPSAPTLPTPFPTPNDPSPSSETPPSATPPFIIVTNPPMNFPTVRPTPPPFIITTFPPMNFPTVRPTPPPFIITTNPPMERPTSELQITILIGLDEEPEETGWLLSRDSTDEVVARSNAGKYKTAKATIEDVAMIDIGEAYLFCVTDAGSNGMTDGTYSVNYKGWPLVLGDGRFEDEACHVVKLPRKSLSTYPIRPNVRVVKQCRYKQLQSWHYY